jgi:hypothetical protein
LGKSPPFLASSILVSHGNLELSLSFRSSFFRSTVPVCLSDFLNGSQLFNDSFAFPQSLLLAQSDIFDQTDNNFDQSFAF